MPQKPPPIIAIVVVPVLFIMVCFKKGIYKPHEIKEISDIQKRWTTVNFLKDMIVKREVF